MRIAFSAISLDGSPYSVEIADLFAPDVLRIRSGRASGLLQRLDDTQATMKGSLETVLILPCDRCLTDYDCSVSSDLDLLFALSVPANESADEDDESECRLLAEPFLDLAEVLREQIWLALPMKRLCSEQCQGLCVDCGKNLNASACHCAPLSGHPAFAVLAKLQKDKA